MSTAVSITGLDRLLAGGDPAGVVETRALLADLLQPVVEAEYVDEQTIWRQRVHRARFRVDGRERTFILKRLPLDRAHREQLALRLWLPHLGLEAHGPPLLGVAAAGRGECIWHVYQDLGPHTLGEGEPEPGHVAAAVRLLAQLHTRAASSAFLGECRQFGVDLGVRFLPTGIADATRTIEGILRRYTDLAAPQVELLERLLRKLGALAADEPERTRVLAAHGGPETLLHGDLWTCNIFVLPKAAGTNGQVHVRFIDWDHAGVGHASYDLSALLLRFPPHERGAVLDVYADAVAAAGWRLPEREILNMLFETAELARLVSSLLWPALAFYDAGLEWACARLAEVERWFERLQPVLVDK